MPPDVLSTLGLTPDEQAALGGPPSPPAPPPAASGGLVNNNPLNLRPLPQGQWAGQTGVAGGFSQFETPQQGWDAAEQNLTAKVNRHGLRSIAQIIGDPTYGWAPAADHNDPASYAAHVASDLGVQPGDDVSQRIATDPVFRHQMLQSMAGIETGHPVPYGGSQPNDAANILGLTPEEAAQLTVGPSPQTPGGQKPDQGDEFLTGPNFAHLTAAAAARFHAIGRDPNRGLDPNADPGTAKLPYYVQAGQPVPSTPALHWVDADGNEHINPGGAVEKAESVGAGLLQGIGADFAASASRLTGGGLAVDNPMAAAFAQTEGRPSAFGLAQGAQDQFRQQGRNYALAHFGDPYAQGGRFGGQAVLGTAAALATPELEAPAAGANAFGNWFAQNATRAASNAFRGVASAAPSVGASDQPVATQLGEAALGGAVLPAVADRLGNAGMAAAGLNRVKLPAEVKALADKMINEHGIPLRASQIAGVVDPSLAIKDSNLINAAGSGFASNQAAQRTAFTRAVAKTFGAASDKITPPVMSAARKDLGQEFDAFAASHSVPDVAPLHANLDATINDASQVLPASELAPLQRQVENIRALTDKNGGTLPGDAYQSLVRHGSPLDRAMQSGDSNIRHYAGKLHDNLSDAIASTATPEELANFAHTRLKYKNLMTVKGLAAKAGITGEISPVQLAGVVNRSFDDRAFSGAGSLGELADGAQLFMKQPPTSMTAQRISEIAGRNWFPSLLAGGAAGEHFLMHDPGTALQLAIGAGSAKAASLGVNAFSGLRYGAGAGRTLIGDQPVRNAFDGFANLSRPAQVPLSALSGRDWFDQNSPTTLGPPAAIGANP